MPDLSRFTAATLLALATLLTASAAQADFIDHFAVTDDVGAHKVPRTGHSRILVLVVQVEGFPAHDMDHIRDFFSPESVPGEFRFTDFYQRMSMGAYTPEATVIGPIPYDACPLPEDYAGFANCRIPRGLGDTFPEILQTLDVGLGIMEDFLQRADGEFGVDFAEYDVNGPGAQPDGWIDGVLLLHNVDFGGYAIPLYWLRRQGPLTLDGVNINIIGMADTPEVAVHEFGHLLGWADLYDEIGNTKGYQYSHMGSWNYLEAPPAVDGFSRSRAGWIAPDVVELGERRTAVRLRPYADSGDLVQVGTGQEYFLLENRGPTGDDYIDRDIDGRGLSITHVNLRKAPTDAPDSWPLRLGGGCVNCDVWGPMLMNEQADSKFELQRPGSRRDDAHDLFHAGDSFVPNLENTNPIGGNNTKLSSNLINGAVSGVSVTNVRFEGDDILVDVAVEEPCALLECGAGTCEAGKCIPPEVDDTPDEPGTNNATNNGESPEPAANAATGKTDDGCATVPVGRSPLGLLLGLAGLVWALRR